MQLYFYPSPDQWAELIERPAQDVHALGPKVAPILKEVREQGDAALYRYTEQFDGVKIDSLKIAPDVIAAAGSQLSALLREAIQQARVNIEAFHAPQVEKGTVVETMPGVRCWRRSVGIERVGLYIPGGSAPLFSTILMLGVPAKLAGCREVILCSPPGLHGDLHPAILYVAGLVGITSVYRVGGAQAIAALAYGTESIPKVSKIFGPGNAFVTAAKRMVQQDGVVIDLPAGPSEVCVLADQTAHPDFVASDLLSQAEHGADSQVLLVTTHEPLAAAVMDAVRRRLEALPRQGLAERALEHSRAVVVRNLEEGMGLVNAYAPEHLILCCANARKVSGQVVNAGSVFLGNYSPESAGDYASGTNHTLPTGGFARAGGGVSVDSFVRKITFQELTKDGLKKLGPTVIEMAVAEGLEAHAEAVRVRL